MSIYSNVWAAEDVAEFYNVGIGEVREWIDTTDRYLAAADKNLPKLLSWCRGSRTR